MPRHVPFAVALLAFCALMSWLTGMPQDGGKADRLDREGLTNLIKYELSLPR